MARVNITVPDELLGRARSHGLNVSAVAAAALAEELDRRAKVAELDAYLADLEGHLGPVPEEELRVARAWAAGLETPGAVGPRSSARTA